MANAYELIVQHLQSMRIPYKIHRHEPVLTMSDVERMLPFQQDRLLKTLVFRIKESKWVYAVVRGKDRVDDKKLSNVLDVSKGDLIRPSPEEVESQLSLQIGGISPIPLRDDTIVVFDNSVKKLGTVFCGVGANNKSLEIHINDLIAASKANVHPIIQEEAE